MNMQQKKILPNNGRIYGTLKKNKEQEVFYVFRR